QVEAPPDLGDIIAVSGHCRGLQHVSSHLVTGHWSDSRTQWEETAYGQILVPGNVRLASTCKAIWENIVFSWSVPSVERRFPFPPRRSPIFVPLLSFHFTASVARYGSPTV
ncbi:hypothetical protein RRG08_000914, partial [Elysia crispata]